MTSLLVCLGTFPITLSSMHVVPQCMYSIDSISISSKTALAFKTYLVVEQKKNILSTKSNFFTL